MPRRKTGKLMLICAVLIGVCFAFNGNGYTWTAPKIEKPAKFADYPRRPIEFTCGWGVGGGADLMARKVGELTEKFYGIKMLVNNMPGAAGAKALDYSMRQPADGYTVFFSAWDSYMNYILGKTEFGPPHLDVLLRAQYVPGAYWVLKDSEFKTWREVIEYSKKNPYKLLLADVGRGGLGDFTLSLWEKCTGLKITYIPYDEPARRYSAFAGKHADILYEQPGDIKPLIDQGARALVFMSEERFPGFTDTPTAKELGCDVTIALWRGVGINNKAPKEIKDYLTKVLCAITESPEYKKFLELTVADPKSVLCGDAAHKFFVAEYEQVNALQKK